MKPWLGRHYPLQMYDMIPPIFHGGLIKVYCHTKLYWNLTKPYHKYEVNKWYAAKFHYAPATDCNLYSFENCDMILIETDLKRYFYTQEEFRENQLDKITKD
jgi:hypothetical protein